MLIENSILQELNQCRSNPSLYSHKLEAFLKKNPNKLRTVPTNISSFLSPLFNYLNTQSPLPELLWSEGLSAAARIHSDSLVKLEVQGHVGMDNSDPGVRANRYCEWSGYLSEVIQYGGTDAMSIVAQLLINEDDPSQIQLIACLKPTIRHMGLAFDKHKTFGSVCVFLFTEKILDETLKNTEKSEKNSQKKLSINKENEKLRLKITPLQETVESHQEQLENVGLTKAEILELKEFFDNAKIKGEVVTSSDLSRWWENREFGESGIIKKILEIDKVGEIDFETFVGMAIQNLSRDFSARISLSPIPSHNIDEPSGEFREIFDVIGHEKSEKASKTEAGSQYNYKAARSVHENLKNALELGSIDLSQIEELDYGGYFNDISESEASVSIATDPITVDEKEKLYGKNSLYEITSENSNRTETKLKKQIKEVFELLDGDESGWISTGLLLKVLQNPEFTKKFQIFYEAFQGITKNIPKLSYNDLCLICFPNPN